MDYRKSFAKTISNAKNILAGCVKVFNSIAFDRYFEHMALNETSNPGVYTNGEGDWVVTKIEDLVVELSYWLSCYYEAGHCRHDEEFSDRIMLIRGLEAILPYCRAMTKDWFRYIPENKDTERIFREFKRN